VEARVELGRDPQVFLSRLILPKREIRATNRFADSGFDFRLAIEPAAEPGGCAVE
jgi:hypothetical protein